MPSPCPYPRSVLLFDQQGRLLQSSPDESLSAVLSSLTRRSELLALLGLEQLPTLGTALECLVADLGACWLEVHWQAPEGYQLVSLWQVPEHAERRLLDPITGLPLRHRFLESLDAQLRREPERPLWVYVIELDRFRDINDALGHEAGDQLLAGVAQALQAASAGRFMIARLYGDAFGAWACEDSAQTPAQLHQQLLQVFEQPFALAGQSRWLSATIGASNGPEQGSDAQTLLRNAYAALNRGKLDPEQRLVAYRSEFSTHIDSRQSLANELKHAIENQQLAVSYQPKWHTRHHRFSCMEALVRWEHPTLGPISPARFIPLAEELGLIGEITRQVVQRVAQEIGGLVARGEYEGNVAVNFSTRDFGDRELIDNVLQILQHSSLAPGQFQFEVTETGAIDDLASVRCLLEELRERGFSVAIDDFGVGYSSLSYIHSLPVQALKIDMSFIQGIDQGENGRNLLNGIVQLAKTQGLELVAEGVDSVSQAHYLAEHGVDYLQGYLVSRPLPLAELRVRLRQPFQLPQPQ